MSKSLEPIEELCWACSIPFGEKYPIQRPVWKCKNCNRYICLMHIREYGLGVNTYGLNTSRELALSFFCGCLPLSLHTPGKNLIFEISNKTFIAHALKVSAIRARRNDQNERTAMARMINRSNPRPEVFSWMSSPDNYFRTLPLKMVMYRMVILPRMQMIWRRKMRRRVGEKHRLIMELFHCKGLGLIESSVCALSVLQHWGVMPPLLKHKMKPEWSNSSKKYMKGVVQSHKRKREEHDCDENTVFFEVD